jgi:hypothetical protein
MDARLMTADTIPAAESDAEPQRMQCMDVEATNTKVTLKDNALAALRLLRAPKDHTDLVWT